MSLQQSDVPWTASFPTLFAGFEEWRLTLSGVPVGTCTPPRSEFTFAQRAGLEAMTGQSTENVDGLRILVKHRLDMAIVARRLRPFLRSTRYGQDGPFDLAEVTSIGCDDAVVTLRTASTRPFPWAVPELRSRASHRSSFSAFTDCFEPLKGRVRLGFVSSPEAHYSGLQPPEDPASTSQEPAPVVFDFRPENQGVCRWNKAAFRVLEHTHLPTRELKQLARQSVIVSATNPFATAVDQKIGQPSAFFEEDNYVSTRSPDIAVFTFGDIKVFASFLRATTYLVLNAETPELQQQYLVRVMRIGLKREGSDWMNVDAVAASGPWGLMDTDHMFWDMWTDLSKLVRQQAQQAHSKLGRSRVSMPPTGVSAFPLTGLAER
jgi:hypothetical protein